MVASAAYGRAALPVNQRNWRHFSIAHLFDTDHIFSLNYLLVSYVFMYYLFLNFTNIALLFNCFLAFNRIVMT